MDKLIKWRGDDENGTKVLEDVIREVVVISDGEDSEDDEDIHTRGRDASVEVISSNAVADQVQTRPVDYANATSIAHEDLRHYSDEDAPSGFRYVPQVAKRKQVLDKKKENRRGFSRYQAWDQAVERSRLVAEQPRQQEALRPLARVEVPYHSRPVHSDQQAFRPYPQSPDDRSPYENRPSLQVPEIHASAERPLYSGPSHGSSQLLRKAPLDKVSSVS